jgi:hypothetical protein
MIRHRDLRQGRCVHGVGRLDDLRLRQNVGDDRVDFVIPSGRTKRHRPLYRRLRFGVDAYPNRVGTASGIGVLAHLERAGWLREEKQPSGPTGGKPVVRWLVNPILFSNLAAETAETAETCAQVRFGRL